MTADQRKWLLIGAAVLVTGIIAYSVMAPSAPAVAPGAAAASARTARVTSAAAKKAKAEAEASGGPVKPVRLEDLKMTRDEPGDAQRNPFRFKPRIVAPPPRPVNPNPVPVAPPAPVTPPGPPPPPPIPLKFIGLVEKSDGFKVAVLTDGKNTMFGREGDIIDGRYKIVKIGVESIELTHADGRGRQTVRLTGQ
jgi:hypothetical protein